jgi:hypothetical protein
MITRGLRHSFRLGICFSLFLITTSAHRSFAADEPMPESAKVEPAASVPETPAQAANDDSEGDAAQANDPVVDFLFRFPKLGQFLSIHAESLPEPWRSRVINSGLRRPIIICIPAAFEPVALTNPAGRQVVLDLTMGQREVLVKPGDSIVIEVFVVQLSTGAMAEGSWIASLPSVISKPDLVHTHTLGHIPFEPGTAIAFAFARHLDVNGGEIDDWSWDREVELISFGN